MVVLNYSKLKNFIKFIRREEVGKLTDLCKRLKHQNKVIERAYKNVSEYNDIVVFIENAQETKCLKMPVQNFLKTLKKENEKLESSLEDKEQKKFILEQKVQNIKYMRQRAKDKGRN